ncbi:hypothetical protein OHB07_16295 [Streptomyces sp. NBC_00111]|uniref:hypothetical protein n=1 Tax=Streptomyces sp. NBC_00111 TaxID=2975655 RepID=UPI00324B9B6D
MNHLADPAAIVLSPASTATYRRYHHDPDPAIGGTTRLPNLPATSADRLVRAHFQTNPTLRSIQATPYGALTLLQGNRNISLEPGANIHPKQLTSQQAEDLLLIAQVGRRAHIAVLAERGPVIEAGLTRIPPAATARLVRHGWAATTGTDRAPVAVSLAGTVALAWRACRYQRVPADGWAAQIAEAVFDEFAHDATA